VVALCNRECFEKSQTTTKIPLIPVAVVIIPYLLAVAILDLNLLQYLPVIKIIAIYCTCPRASGLREVL